MSQYQNLLTHGFSPATQELCLKILSLISIVEISAIHNVSAISITTYGTYFGKNTSCQITLTGIRST